MMAKTDDRIAAADDKSMLTIIPTVQKAELLRVATYMVLYIHVYFSTTQKRWTHYFP